MLTAKLTEAEKSAKETFEAVSRREAAHEKELDASLNRSGAFALKKDMLQKEKNILACRVEELEELLKKEEEEKLEVQKESQRYCEDAVIARGLKIKLDEQLA